MRISDWSSDVCSSDLRRRGPLQLLSFLMSTKGQNMAAHFDLLIRNGTVVDGRGGAPFKGDVGIRDGLVVAVGDVEGTAEEEIDAAGCLVTPGFVDIHTHYDGQVTWEQGHDPSARHGGPTTMTGNCGVGIEPFRPDNSDRTP